MGSGLITSTFFSVLKLLLLALTCFQLFAFVDAAIRPSSAYLAANKLTKVAWLLILGIAVVYDVKWGSVTSILTIVGAAAAIIYTVDVRPAVRQYAGSSRGKNRQKDRSSSDGPYGPW
ncbi:DUF2516 family protein [Actinospica robiniae]|uniref:DUF2516 family protein n=1 Tax=Actinospica robiniae TaxID=304901 RepID=UPI0003FAABF8|nr:DUF2516 family protein [Actinospica robiniae]